MAEQSSGAYTALCKVCGCAMHALTSKNVRRRCEACKREWHRLYSRKRRHGTIADPVNLCRVCGKEVPYERRTGQQRQHCENCVLPKPWVRKLPKSCEHCGNVFMARQARNKYCSKECQYSAKRTTPLRRARECDNCGKQYIPCKLGSLARAGQTTPRFCSRICAGKAGAYGHGRKPKQFLPDICRCCETEFVRKTGRHSKIFCSAECRQQYALRRIKQSEQTYAPRPCSVCSVLFVPRTPRAKVCSDECKKERKRQIIKAARAKRRKLYGNKYRNRARHFGVEYEPVNVKAVFERDNWRCQICGSKTPAKLRGSGSERAPELDHRIPMALGGPHTYENVQCACRKCNHSKNAKHVSGQIPLFARL